MSAKNTEGETPLHLACERNHLKLVKLLIKEKKADPAVTYRGGKSALHYAADTMGPNILRYLIEDQMLDIEATDNLGRTALHIACQSQNFYFQRKWETQKYLIEVHPKIIEAKDKKGKTALHYCLQQFEKDSESFRTIALLLATKQKHLKTQENQDSDHIFDWIKQNYANDTKKSKGEDEAVSCLNAVFKMFQKQLTKNPLLYIVGYFNRVDIAEYMFTQDLCYIETHFNAEEADSKRKLLLESYLEFSCENGLLDLTRFLFQEIKNRQESFEHWTFYGCLKTACTNKHFDVWKYLLEEDQAKDGAAEFLKNFPLHYACKNGSLKMVQYLIEEQNANINTTDRGMTPLFLACFSDSIEIVQYLIEKQKANIYTINNRGRSVWHFACMSGSLELVKYISQTTEQHVNVQDEDGSTALHLVCQQYKPSLKVVKFLVSKGANVLAKDKSGQIPLQIAKYEEANRLIPFLEIALKR